ncbi:MAG: TadE/TadG family type IV pilus assembly protein [Anaerolineae bacterium]|nr:TadE/TadG family type IV pilus assembly protein [Anaerolineae bacterium]
MVEFALALPILILILSGIIDIGRAYFAYIYINEAAQEGALYAALYPICVDEDVNLSPLCDNPNNATWRARNSGSTQGIIGSNNISVTTNTTTPLLGDMVVVTVTVPFKFITPGISAIAVTVTGSDTLTLTATAGHVVIIE